MLRFYEVSTSQEAFENFLGRPVQLLEARRDGSQTAQIDLSSDDDLIHWDALISAIGSLSNGIASMIENGAIATAKLDIALPFYFPRNLAASITIPVELCALAGRTGIAIEVTYCATCEDDEDMSEDEESSD